MIEDGLARFQNFPVKHGFSTLSAGNMSLGWGEEKEVERNREIFFQKVGVAKEKRIHLLPEHEDRILIVGEKEAGQIIKGDGLITTTPGISLTLCPADCFPVLITDKNVRFVSLFHVGWQGTDRKIIKKAISLIKEKLDIEPEDLRFGIGPGIHCYESKKAALALLPKLRWWPFLHLGSLLDLEIDLLEYNIEQIQESGVLWENIFIADHCTCCSKASQGYLFFSHQRTRKTGEKEGRFLTVATL